MTNEQLVTLIKNKVDVSGNMLKLWQQNIKFIKKIAGSYRRYEETEDLVQQAYIGLCNAVDGYRAEEGVPFMNYAAFWIRQSMVRYIENCGSVVKIPSHEQVRQRKYVSLVRDFEARTGRKPAEWEICHYMQISKDMLYKILKNTEMIQIRSLDVCVGEDGETSMGDLVPDETDVEGDVLEKIEREELCRTIWSVVDTLPGKQPQVIRAVYQEGKTLKAVGEEMGGISIERARQIKLQAMTELRKPSRRNKLIAFLPEALGSLAYKHNGHREFERTWTSSTELAALKMRGEITGHVRH